MTGTSREQAGAGTPGERSDAGRLTIAVTAFGMALGATAFAFPLLALDAGLGATSVGLLASASAAAQMASRLALPAMLSRFRDRDLMTSSLLVLMGSAAILVVTRAPAGFILANLAQGLARGVFHTASQTHGVRNPGVPGRRLAFVQTSAQFGRLIGPAAAGTLALISLTASILSAVALGGIGIAATWTLNPMPPYRRAPRGERTPIWRQRRLFQAAWGGAIGGVWKGVEESFIPVVLAGAGLADSQIGWMLSVADGASFATTAAVAKWGGPGVGSYVPLSAIGMAIPLMVIPHVSGVVPLAGLLLVAGSGGGVANVLGMADAHAAVEESEQGAAIALVGTYRAAARLTAPAMVSGILAVASLAAGLAVTAAASLLPVIRFRPLRPHRSRAA